ncbi:MAG: carbon-nitrogen hydrolase family protein [Acidaminococcaceae bacterium]|nr:carbon-nitrogen hydrolase family protein [Acidaminococcaceae bacterium]MBQ6778768.1 carbon-nitrogen hydrolase family protein [Acidaminococcaceae bacterium]
MKIKVAAIQMNCKLGDVDANLEKAEGLLKEAVEKGAEWAIFPELFNTAYWIPKQDVELAEDIPEGRTTQWMIAQAKKYKILVSGCILANTPNKGIITDTALTVDENGVLGTYDKVHLWDNEELRFQNGSKVPAPIPYGDLRIGMQICYEIGFPDISRLMVLQGANVIIYPAAFGRARYYVWDIQSKARALENGIYVIAVNRAGVDDNTVFLGGHSRIVAPDGSVICEAGRDEDAVLIAEIDINKCTEARRTVPYLRDLNKALIKSEWAKL